MAIDVKNLSKYIILPRYYTPSNESRLFNAIIVYLLILFISLTTLTILIGHLIYYPSKPHFSIVDVAVYQFNTSSTPVNTLSIMQFNVETRNPNEHASIMYDHLSAYVAYRNKPVTLSSPLPPLSQESNSTVWISSVLAGGLVPVSREVTDGLTSDLEFGVVGLQFVLLGRIEYWGSFFIWRNGLEVRCDMLLGLRNGTVGKVPMLADPKCDVNA